MSIFQCIALHIVLHSHFITGEMTFENKPRSYVVRISHKPSFCANKKPYVSELISQVLKTEAFRCKSGHFVCRGALEYRNLVLLWK